MPRNITFNYNSIKQLSWSRLGLTLNIRHNNVLVCSCFFLLTGYCRIKRFWNSSRTVVEQRKEFSLCFTERYGAERSRTEKHASQLCWNVNDQIFTQSVFVQMKKSQHVQCYLETQDQKHCFFCLENPYIFSLCLYIIIQKGTEQNGPEWSGTELSNPYIFSLCFYVIIQNKTERNGKNRQCLSVYVYIIKCLQIRNKCNRGRISVVFHSF